MRVLQFFEDPDTREDILDHISGFVFDRAAHTMSDEPMRAPAYVRCTTREQELPRKRSVRR